MLICITLIISFAATGESTLAINEGKIIGGSPISISQAKYQISLRVKPREISHGFGSGHICGGSVIAQRTIVTAAHCVENYASKNLKVVMGNAKRLVTDDQCLQYNVQKIVKHQNYNASTLQNDIALLFIDGYIPWNWPTVAAVKLSTAPTAANTPCLISGWGNMANGQLSSSLLGASVPIISYQQCFNSYGLVPHSMICAGYISQGGIDACQGDSGGPLVCNNLLTGIISWGDGCALANRPGVYTNISAFHGWIVKTNSSFNYSFYGGATDLSLNMFLSIFLLSIFLFDVIN